MWGGPLARVNSGADVLGERGYIFHDGKRMDRDAAGRVWRVRFLLCGHVEARTMRMRGYGGGGGRRREWVGVR